MHRWSHPMNGIRVMGLSPGIHPTGRALLGTCATLRHSQSFMVFFFSLFIPGDRYSSDGLIQQASEHSDYQGMSAPFGQLGAHVAK